MSEEELINRRITEREGMDACLDTALVATSVHEVQGSFRKRHCRRAVEGLAMQVLNERVRV